MASGPRWLLMLLAQILWVRRVWALPLLTVLAPSERYVREHQRQHKQLTDWVRMRSSWRAGFPIDACRGYRQRLCCH